MSPTADVLQSTLQTVTRLGHLAKNFQEQQADHPYPHKILLTETEAASLLHVSKSFLRDHRYKGVAPAYYKLGNNVRYDYFELMDYVENCRQRGKVEQGD